MSLASNYNSHRSIELPDRIQRIVDVGINMIEVQLQRTHTIGPSFYGMIDVDVKSYWDRVRSINKTTVNWHDNGSNYIQFEANRKTGICTGFIPDDPTWINRVHLAGRIDEKRPDMAITIMRSHTKDGILSGATILSEIEIVRDYIYDWIVWDGRTVAHTAKTREACEIWMEKNGITHKTHAINRGRNQLIENLYKLHGGGWIRSNKFQNEIKQEISLLIASKIKSPQTENLRSLIQDAALTMGKSEIAAIASALLDAIRSGDGPRNVPNDISVGEEETQGAQAPDSITQDTPTKEVEQSLADMSLGQLRRIAKEQKIPIEKSWDRDQIIKVIEEFATDVPAVKTPEDEVVVS
jgi:hypothetical protein